MTRVPSVQPHPTECFECAWEHCKSCDEPLCEECIESGGHRCLYLDAR